MGPNLMQPLNSKHPLNLLLTVLAGWQLAGLLIDWLTWSLELTQGWLVGVLICLLFIVFFCFQKGNT